MVLCLSLVLGIACSGEGDEEGVKKVKFGIGLPLTGAYAGFAGLPAKYGFELARDKIGEFEVNGERYRWALIFEDNLLSVAGGAASARKLIYDDDVDFMFQSGGDAGMAAAVITEEVGTILDIGGGSPFDLGPDMPQTFQTLNPWHLVTPPFFDWLTKEHPEVKRVAATQVEGELGATMVDAIRGCCDYYGLKLRAEPVPFGTVEYYPMVTRMMAYHPDLVIGILEHFKVLWEMGYDGLCASFHWTEAGAGAVDWNKATGMLIYMPHPFGNLWSEVTAIAAEFEQRYGVEFTTASMQTFLLLLVYTQVLKEAGTVDDVDQIIETMERGTFSSPVGPVHYGGEALNGIGHVLVWPCPIYEIVGKGEYQVIRVYTPAQSEAIAEEVYPGR